MNLATPPLRDLAARLLASEQDRGAGGNESALGRVCGKLGVIVTKLAGVAGYRSLLSRALHLAQDEVPWLKPLTVLPEGTLAGLHGLDPKMNTDERALGEAVLIAQLLGLLSAFVGEPLTMQLVKQAWPHASIPTEDARKGSTP